MPPTIKQQTFAASIVTPLAQVTVVDGGEGDCNVVDFCRLATTKSTSSPTKTVYPDNAWRRTMIDTGPSGGQTATNIVATLQLLATQQPYPALATDPTGAETPLLEELQITHPDDDHIGNAAAFLTAMCNTSSTTAYIENCNVVYCRIPPLYQAPQITPETPTSYTDKYGHDMNRCVYTAGVPKVWRESMEKAGFALEINLYPQNHTILEWNLNDDEAEWDDDTQNGITGPTCTLYYSSDAVDNDLKPKLEAQVRIFLPEQGNLEATLKKQVKKVGKVVVRKWWEATVSKNTDVLSSAYTEVPMTQTQVEDKLQSTKEFELEWTSSPPKKKAKGTPAAKLMSNMVMRQPLATAPFITINSNLKNAVRAEPHIIRSVNQVLELRTVITNLNKSATKPNLKPVVPVTSQIVRPKKPKELKSAAGYQYTIGPSAAQYKSMMRTIMLNRWALDGRGKLNSPGVKNNLDGETTNRSSIVTMFERHDKYTTTTSPAKTIDASFSMLFTGDAFDKACDIRDTLLSWRSDTINPTMQIDVLKIPHHGSDVSTSSGFYSFCRAYVYFVCGSHCNTHGNPKLSMLEAIVKGFYGKSAPGGQPFRLFFSNPSADVDWTSSTGASKSLSAVTGILNNPILKPSATFSTTGYYYEMYRLKSIPTGYASFGQVLFGKDGDNNLITWWDPSMWVKMS